MGFTSGGSAGTPAGYSAYIGTSGYAGQGGFGGDYSGYDVAGGGGGGGGGYSGGGGGAGNGYLGGDGGYGGGGGGGSSYIASNPALTATSTTAGVNYGDGSLTITPITPLQNLNQYILNTTTTLGEGSSTNTGVTFGATLTSSASTTLQLQVEVEPTGTAFLGIPNVTSSIFVSPGTAVSTTFTRVTGGYHWQARQVNASGTATVWQVFGPNASSTDFILANTFVETYTGSVASFTVPAHVLSLTLTANGAQGNAGGGSSGGAGANGGQAIGTLSNPSGTYYYYVGSQGGGGSGGTGWAGGGNGGAGGGMTWFSSQNTFDQSHTIIVGAGGGGGGGYGSSGGGGGGNGGGASGGTGGLGAGGGGGSQTSGGTGGPGGGCVGGGASGSAGLGGNGHNGGNPNGIPAGGGAGGGNGYYGGGGGGAVYGCNYSGDGAGGGGGSSFVAPDLTATGTTSGVNSGNGSLSIVETFDPVPSLSSSSQYRSDGSTVINEGSSTSQVPVVLAATLNSWTGRDLQLQVEVQPSSTPFANTPNVTSSPFVAPGNVATTTFTGTNGSYHWQARAVDVENNTSTWTPYGVFQSGKAFQVDTGGTLTTNLASYWNMEGNSKDYWGTNNGTDTAMSYGTSYGKVNQGAFFGGSGYINAGDGTSLQITGNLSVAFWLKLPSLSGTYGIVTKTDDSSGRSYGVWTEGSGALTFAVASGGGGSTQSDWTNTVGDMDTNWHLWVFTFNPSTKTFTAYKDGSVDSTFTAGNTGFSGSTIYNSATDVFLGARSGGAWIASGDMDEVGIWNKILSSTEVSNLYNSGNGQTMVTSTSTPAVNFVLAVPHINFTFPTQGTTTPNFPNWQMKADTVTSTDSYALTVDWDDTTGDPAQSSTIMASGTALLAGVNVPKPTSSIDYTYDGTPVLMNATATLYDATTTTATNSISFTEQTTVAPLGCGSNQIQCISYKYDNDGNVTQIADNSATNAAITVNYAYDALNRLVSASSSDAASGQNYLQTFSYDPVGNILTGPKGTYSYNGASNADPDAVTGIANGTSTTQFTYDNNGNLTNASSGTYTWDYRNELTAASSSNTTSSYGYDYTSQRVKLVSGTSTTYYPETTYSVTGSTKTKHIFFDGLLVATVINAPSSTAAINYVADDMLGGMNDVVNSSGTVIETGQYFPYGSIRIDNATGTTSEVRKYIGQQYDAATQLSYLNARYYNGAQGQFLSEDPSFLAIGNPNRVQQLTNQSQMALLANPQQLNAYSYSQDNPIIKSDPSGDWYLDINVSFLAPLVSDLPIGIGPSAGVLISQQGIYGYVGGAIGSAGKGWSVAYSSDNPSEGWSAGASEYYGVGSAQSYSLTGSGGWSTEYGIGSPGISVGDAYTKQLISFGPATYYVSGNQAQTAASLQNANPLFSSSVRSTNAITANSGSRNSSGYNSSPGSGNSLNSQQIGGIQAQLNAIAAEIQVIEQEINSLK